MPKLSVDVLLRPSTPCVLLLTPAAVEFAMEADLAAHGLFDYLMILNRVVIYLCVLNRLFRTPQISFPK